MTRSMPNMLRARLYVASDRFLVSISSRTILIAGSASIASPGDGLADSKRLRIHQNEGQARRLIRTVDPAVVGAALNHHITRLHADHRAIHLHLYLARQNNDIVKRFSAMDRSRTVRREVDDGKPRASRGWCRAKDTRPVILDIFTGRYVGRAFVGGPDQGGNSARRRELPVVRRAILKNLGNIAGVVTSHDSPQRRQLIGGRFRFLRHLCSPTLGLIISRGLASPENLYSLPGEGAADGRHAPGRPFACAISVADFMM